MTTENICSRLYETLLLIRSTETRMDELRIAQGGGDFMAQSRPGWDVFVAPVCLATEREDVIMSADAPYAAYLSRGSDLSRLMTEMMHSYAFTTAPSPVKKDFSALGFVAPEGRSDLRPFISTDVSNAREKAEKAEKGKAVAVYFTSDNETKLPDLVRCAEECAALKIPFLAYYYMTQFSAEPNITDECEVIMHSDALRQEGAPALYREAAQLRHKIQIGDISARIVCLNALPPRGAEAPVFGRDYLTSCFYRWQARDPLAELAKDLTPEELRRIIFAVQDNLRDAERRAEDVPSPLLNNTSRSMFFG